MRGMTLIEVMIALAVLGVASLGLAGSLVVSSNSNSIAARRTVMSAFAQARIENLTSMTRSKIPIVGTASGTFDPMSNPTSGGWVMDTIDGTSVPTGAGDDLLFGPILVDSASENGNDGTLLRTTSLRKTVPNCADKAVTSDPAVFCREVHIESYWQGTPAVPMLRAYVRVIQGGGLWQRSYVLLQQDIAQ
jgi:prepilin-type N-terminal cleavage/methylation domain-containing protein